MRKQFVCRTFFRLVIVTAVSLGTVLLAAAGQAQTHAYVANSADNSVSVVDTGTNSVITTIPVGSFPNGVAVTPDGTRAYVINENSNSVSVIDTATNTVISDISVAGPSVTFHPLTYPNGVAITPDGTRAYVTVNGQNAVWVIDTATNTVVTTISVLLLPVSVAITPDGTRAYVVDVYSDAVSVIETATNSVVANIPNIGGLPVGVAILPNGTRAYITELGGAVAVIDTATNTLLSTITIPSVPVAPQFSQAPLPIGIAITPDGTKAYVADLYGNTISVVNTTTDTVVVTIPAGGYPIGVAISPDGTRAYATNIFVQFCTVSVIDTATNTVVTTIPVGVNPFAVAITPGVGPPTHKDQCKDDGWKTFTIPEKFKNQGACISFVNSKK